MSNKCLLRVEQLLRKSSIKAAKKDEIINQIKIAQAEKKITNIDSINVDKVAKEVTEQIKLQKKINKRNAIENEIKIRNYTEYVLREFPDNPEEGLIAVLVGSNQRKIASRASVAIQQQASVNQLIAGFNQKLRENNVTELFDTADRDTQLRVSRTMEELNQRKTDVEEQTGLKPPITETNPKIIKLAEIMEGYSEMIRQKLNDRGANISKMWGYIVRQSHDPFSIRDAANKLGLKDIEPDTDLKTRRDRNYNRNFKAWKNFVMEKLDQERTFAGVDDMDGFMVAVYNTLVGNKYQMADGASFAFGGRITTDVAKSSKFKRVLHFKSADDWFVYNDMFGVGNLKESFFSGLQTSGRNIGMIDSLGTKPTDNFNRIRQAVHERLVKLKKDTESTKSNSIYEKYLNNVDGSVYSVEKFPLAKYSAILRSIIAMAKLGGATISAAADIGLYGSEMRWQGRSFLGGMFEALNNLRKIKNPKQLKSLFETYNIDSTRWDIIRKTAMETADDGKEFINIADLDKITDAQVKEITGINDLTQRQIQIEKDKFKASVSGMLLDRSIYAVIEPDVRGKAILNGGRMSGTYMGEIIKFVMQFKAFPFAIVQKTLGREADFFRKGANQDIARGITGMASILIASAFMGYLSMTAKDLLRGKKPRDPREIKSFFAALLQGGGLGIYGDVLFNEVRTAGERIGSLAGPATLTAGDVIQAIYWGIRGKGGKTAKSAYNAVVKNIPFLNLFYIKSAFDYLIGYQMMEILSPGVLKRVEKRMKKDYNQEFLFTKPSTLFKGLN